MSKFHKLNNRNRVTADGFELATSRKISRLVELGIAHKDWYEYFNCLAREYCKVKGWDIKRFMEVLAVTSPQISVNQNITYTIAYMQSGDISKLMKTTKLALKHYEKTGEIRGEKTEPFSRACQGDNTALVLDVWMARAFNVPQEKLFRKSDIFPYIKQVMHRVAEKHGLTIAQAQACIWEAMRILDNRNPVTFKFA